MRSTLAFVGDLTRRTAAAGILAAFPTLAYDLPAASAATQDHKTDE